MVDAVGGGRGKRREKKGQYWAVFGNIAIPRQYCGECKSMALVVDSALQCCNQPVVVVGEKWKRESLRVAGRRLPSARKRREQIEAQGDRCLYCDRRFDTWVTRKAQVIRLRVCWDHVLPFAYGRDNRDINFVAACQVCNGFKSDLMFADLDAARIYVAGRWESAVSGVRGANAHEGK